ncbi:hypothetical protein JCM15765_37840 [Paradesulfitobacterium aromaticivorans]
MKIGRQITMMIAQTTTREIATETCCFSALTEPPIAIDAETPQIDPAAARVVAKRLSSPKIRVPA